MMEAERSLLLGCRQEAEHQMNVAAEDFGSAVLALSRIDAIQMETGAGLEGVQLEWERRYLREERSGILESGYRSWKEFRDAQRRLASLDAKLEEK